MGVDINHTLEQPICPLRAGVNKGHLTLITEEKVGKKKLDKLVENYGVNAILVGRQSSNTAFLHTGAEKDLPRLWSTIYFDWNEKWSLHL